MQRYEGYLNRRIGFDTTGMTAAQIDAAKPKFAYVMNLLKENMTVITEVIGVANMIAAQIAQHQKETS